MPSSCAVADCKNVKPRKSTKENDSSGAGNEEKLIFHSFPKQNLILCRHWIQLCQRQDPVNPSTAVICSAHFREEDYLRDLEHELIGLPPRKRRRLNPEAVPSVFPLRTVANNDAACQSDRSERLEKRKRKKVVQEILDNHARVFESLENQENQPPEQAMKQEAARIVPGVKCQTELTKAGLSKLERDLGRARRQNEKKDKIISKQRDKIKSQKTRISGLRTKLRNTFPIKKAPEIQKYPRRRWSMIDIVRALQLRSNSSKGYNTARELYQLPLPCIATLKKYASNFRCSPGILTDVLSVLKTQAESMPEWKRACSLYFDEMYLLSKSVHDKQEDAIVGHQRVQVVMIRGILDDWKQPIYFEFDADMTKEKLFTIINRVESAGFFVHSITCDLGPKNLTLLSALGISHESESKCYFPNPSCPDRKIFAFPDIPHMLKLHRNHLIDDGVHLASGIVIDLQLLEQLAVATSGELKLCPKFNLRDHLQLRGADRMRVRPAAQVFSHHVSTLSKKLFPRKLEVSDFFQLFNDGFDICNSRTPHHSHKLKGAYRGTREQKQILKKLRETISSMRFLASPYDESKPSEIYLKPILPCQEGFMISINSTLGIYEDLKAKYGIQYLLTSRFNQDSLESLFGRIRGFGGPNSHPTAAEFKHRLRLILLGKVYKSPQGCNIDMHEDDGNYLSAGLLQKNSLGSEVLTPRNTAANILVSDIGPNDDESLHYLAGYVAWNLKRKGKGNFTKKTRRLRSNNSWLSMLSRGRLVTPTDEISNWVRESNTHFKDFIKTHGKESAISTKLLSYLKERLPNADENVLVEFMKVRIRIYVKYLNEMRKTGLGKKSKKNVKKAKEFAQSAM